MENKLKIDNNTVVHCATEELANKVLAIADGLGYKWANGEHYLNNNYYDKYKHNTCYEFLKGVYGNISDYAKPYTIISAKDFLKLHNEETKQEKPILYYIRGVEDRGEEVIKMLEDKGGINKNNLDGKSNMVYYIKGDNLIDLVDYEDDLGIVVTIFGVELFLPEKPKEYQFKPFDKVLVRSNKDDHWRCVIYSHRTKCKEYPHYCIDGISYDFCIPYEGNEHLLGTTNNE